MSLHQAKVDRYAAVRQSLSHQVASTLGRGPHAVESPRKAASRPSTSGSCSGRLGGSREGRQHLGKRPASGAPPPRGPDLVVEGKSRDLQPVKDPFPQPPRRVVRDAWQGHAGWTTEAPMPRDAAGEWLASNYALYNLARKRMDAVMGAMSPRHEEWVARKSRPVVRQASARQLRRDAFNGAVAALKERIHQRGHFGIAQHFRALDEDGTGTLERDEFRRAIRGLNIGAADGLEDALMDAVDTDGSGSVNYNEFCSALRFGRVQYLPKEPELRMRAGPDPDLPFGDTNLPGPRPWGVMSDATRALEAFDRRISERYGDIRETFQRFDADGSGEVDLPEFRRAMASIPGLHLSAREVTDLFKAADRDYSGTISYDEFVLSFSGGGGRRFLPEFLKPRSLRRSQPAHPWQWDVRTRNPYGGAP